jgi:hypothetical protein
MAGGSADLHDSRASDLPFGKIGSRKTAPQRHLAPTGGRQTESRRGVLVLPGITDNDKITRQGIFCPLFKAPASPIHCSPDYRLDIARGTIVVFPCSLNSGESSYDRKLP